MPRLLLALALLGLIIACAPKIEPDQSQLLDRAAAHFLGSGEAKEFPGDAVVWDETHLLILGRQKPLAARPQDPFTGFLWLVDAETGRMQWQRSLDTLEAYDVLPVDHERALVLLNRPRAQRGSEFFLQTLNRAGEVVDQTRHTAPAGMWGARLTRLAEDHVMVTVWKPSADSTELICDDVHVTTRGARINADWSVVPEQLYPLKDGSYLGKRERAVKNGGYALTEIVRLGADGAVRWKVANPMDSVRAGLSAVVETSGGDLLLAGGRADQRYEPVLAKYSAAGERRWVKRPVELQGYYLAGLAHWMPTQFLVAAQKPLSNRKNPLEHWESLAALIVDEDGNVLDRDVIHQHWTMAVSGIDYGPRGRFYITGMGGANPKEFLKQNDIALYVVAWDSTRSSAK